MTNITTAIIEEMQEQLNEINADNQLHQAELSYQVAKAASIKLHEQMDQYCFQNQEEEISYFKHIKPVILRELLYYAEVRCLEASRPVTDKPAVEEYLEQQRCIYHHYFRRDLVFYNYYRTDKTHQDAVFFTRRPDGAVPYSAIPPEALIDCYCDGNADYCYKLAKIQAHERLIGYIEEELSSLREPEDTSYVSPYRKLKWTDTDVRLTELVYALQAAGSINHGTAKVKEIMSTFEYFFQVKVSNCYNAFTKNIQNRKDPAAYINILRKSLEHRIAQCGNDPRHAKHRL